MRGYTIAKIIDRLRLNVASGAFEIEANRSKLQTHE